MISRSVSRLRLCNVSSMAASGSLGRKRVFFFFFFFFLKKKKKKKKKKKGGGKKRGEKKKGSALISSAKALTGFISVSRTRKKGYLLGFMKRPNQLSR